jgi:hypothetical protein
MIRKEQLRPGDLLFYRPKAALPGSWLIAWMQNVVGKSPIHKVSYCHVAIIDADTDYLLESRWPKSKRWKIDWKKLNKHYYIELWRMRNVEQPEIDKALEWAHANLGQWYDLGLFVWGMFDGPHMEVCSTFVAKAWRAAGRVFKIHKKIGAAEDFWSPDELIANTDLIKMIAITERK